MPLNKPICTRFYYKYTYKNKNFKEKDKEKLLLFPQWKTICNSGDIYIN